MALGPITVGTATLTDFQDGFYKQTGLTGAALNQLKVSKSPPGSVTLVDQSKVKTASYSTTFKKVSSTGLPMFVSIQYNVPDGVLSTDYATFVSESVAGVNTGAKHDLLRIGAI